MNLFTKKQMTILGFHCSHYKTEKVLGKLISSSYRYLAGKDNEFVLQIYKSESELTFKVIFWKEGIKQWERNITEKEEVLQLLVKSEYDMAIGAERKFIIDEVLDTI